MAIRSFALIIGIVFLMVGVAGFIPALVEPPYVGAPDVAVHSNHGYLLGLFPINLLHNIVHLVVGIAGIASYRSVGAARTFSRALAVVYGLLAIMGLFPVLNTTFGLIPIHGHDVWLHAITAIFAAYFGWFAPATYPSRARTATEGYDYDEPGPGVR